MKQKALQLQVSMISHIMFSYIKFARHNIVIGWRYYKQFCSFANQLLHSHIGVPDPPRDLAVNLDDSPTALIITITWQPPANLGQFDLHGYTINVTSTSSIHNSAQILADTTWQFTDERRKKATFNATIIATNKCGQTSDAVSTTEDYVPGKQKIILQM